MARLVRRLADVIFSSLGLVLLSPLFVVIAIAIRRTSSLPILYWGDRVGRHGKPFKICKFSTMQAGPAGDQKKITAEDDPRITRVGKVLRDSKLNELPQLWNVLIGEMSLVGPRPEDPKFVAEWPHKDAATILSVRPGITSPASVIFRDEEKLLKLENVIESYMQNIVPSKLRLDVLYVRNRTLVSDLDVLFWTIAMLLPRMREREVPEQLLVWGPFSQFVTRYFSWFVMDFGATLFAFSASAFTWRLSTGLEISLLSIVLISFAITLLFSIINAMLGLNRVWWSRAKARQGVDLLASSSLAVSVMFTLNIWVFKEMPLPSGMFLLTGAIAFSLFLIIRYRTRLVSGLASRWTNMRQTTSGVGERLLIVGAGRTSELVRWLLNTDLPSELYVVAGYVDDAPEKQGLDIQGVRVLGTTQELDSLVKRYDIGAIAYAIRHTDADSRKRILGACKATGLPIIVVPEVLDTLNASLRMPPVDGATLLSQPTSFTTTSILSELDSLLVQGDLSAARARIREYQNADLGRT